MEACRLLDRRLLEARQAHLTHLGVHRAVSSAPRASAHLERNENRPSGKLCRNRREASKMGQLLSEEQYNELAQFWHEFMMLGPTQRQKRLNLTGLALDFSEWIDSVEDEPYYGLPEILAFFAEKKRREGTTVNEW
jgi:hypothetical protein